MAGAAFSSGATPPPDEEIVGAYLRQGLSTRQIARRFGLSRQRVARRLRDAGVTVAPRGAGRRRDQRRVADPANLGALLAELYVEQRLTSAQVADRLGMSERTVRNRLAEFGIGTRTRGRCNREDRRSLPAVDVTELYHRAELAADQVGAKVGASGNLVLRTAHELGIPVRLGGAPPRTGPQDIELVEALYADPLVARTLARHRIGRVPAGGPIWQRFPRPVPLTAALVTDLYVECGVSVTHIELLTGHPTATVLRRLRAAAVPLRPPGGRSPFRRRWRERQRGAVR